MHPILRERAAGILLPIFSLPSEEGRGDFNSAMNYLSFLKEAGLRYWQILPLNEPDKYNSPYASFSLDSMNLNFLSTELLYKEKYVNNIFRSKEGKDKFSFLWDQVDFDRISREEDFVRFKNDNKAWLKDIVLFRLLEKIYGSSNIYSWPKPFLHRNEQALKLLEKENAQDMEKLFALEYLAHRQWKDIRLKANSLGIKIIGDLPYYPGASSVEVWAYPQYFLLDNNRKPIFVSGVPGDPFDPEGQIWNSPVYNWDAIIKDGFGFFKDRIYRKIQDYDFLRLDHFRGYEKFFVIPHGQKAKNGFWKKGPAITFLQSIEKYKNALLAEDLGTLDADFYQFMEESQLPGMGIMAFENPNDVNYKSRIYYTGNHDTESLTDYIVNMDSFEEIKWLNFLHESISKETLLYYALNRREKLCIFQHADLIDRKNMRINIPGSTYGNWEMQLSEGDFSRQMALYIKNLLIEVNRYDG